MRGHLDARDIALAILAIGGVALLTLLVAAKLHWIALAWWLSIVIALAVGVAVWLIGRRWFALAWLTVLGFLRIPFEDVPDLGDPSGGDQQSGKEVRRAKLERAIARREALLKQLGARA
jgi:hypothetical protein